MAIARSFVVLATIAFCFTQVLAQKYQPKCQNTTAYIIDIDSEFQNWGPKWLDSMISTNKEFRYLNVGDLNGGFLYSAAQYSVASVSWSVDTLNMILADIPERGITTGRIMLIVSMYIPSHMLGYDSASALVTAANRLKEQYDVEIFIVDTQSNSPTSIGEYYYKIAQDVASNPVEGHVVLDYELDFELFYQYAMGVRSTSCVSLGGLYFYTLDGASYDFNGLGEYLLYAGSDYQAQVRLAPCDYSNPASRTCLKGIAVKSANTGYVIEVHYDPVAEYISVYFQGSSLPPTVHYLYSTVYYGGDFEVTITKVQTPHAEPIFQISIRDAYSASETHFGFFVGRKMGLSMYTTLDRRNIGSTTGLCGTWDGCLDNEYYSQNQTFTPVNGSPRDIYYNFAESWRVSEATSFFTHGVNARYYMPSYGSYSPQWNPAFTGVEATATASNDCAFFQNISPFLYTVCVDEVSKGNTDMRTITYFFALSVCSDLCYDGFTSATFISASYCASTCPREIDLDLHEVYDNTTFPPYSLYATKVGATFTPTLGGAYTFALTSDFCPESMVTGTVQITCDQPPTVSAGDDIVLKKDKFHGWPILVILGSASDENTPELEASWTVISTPMAGNQTLGSWPPYSYGPWFEPSIYQGETSLALQAAIYYPGDYVFELSVFDGCYIAKDRVTVHAVCDVCELHVEASGIADQTWTTGGYFPSTSSVLLNYFDYVYVGEAEPHWFIDSNSRGYSFEYPEHGSPNDVYDFVIVPPEIIINTTVIGETFISNNETSYAGPINTAAFFRYEGLGHFKTETFTNTTQITTTTTYSSVPIPITQCSISINDAYAYEASLEVVFDAYANVSRPFTQQPACIGDYAVRVGLRDECLAAHDVTNFHIGCGEQPQAHLVTCQKTLKFDYNTLTFPTITFDGSDTYDPDTLSEDLLYQWELVTPTHTTYLSGCANPPVPLTDAYPDCPSVSFVASEGPGIYNLTMWVSDGCSYDYESTSFIAQCEPLSASGFATDVVQDVASPANGVANLTGSFISEHDVEFYWWLEDAPPGFDDMPNWPTYNTIGANATVEVYLRGTYTYRMYSTDQCQLVAHNVSFTYTCGTMSFVAAAVPSTVAFPAGSTFPTSTITIDMNTTVNTASDRAYYRASLIAKPVGSSVSIPSDFDWLQFYGGANPTIDIQADKVGDYVVQVWVTDSCNVATQTVTVTATCQALTPAIDGVSSTYTIPSLGYAVASGISISNDFLNYTISWELVDALNNSIPIVDGFGATTAVASLSTSGTYHIRVTAETGLDGCSATTNSIPITATCNFTLAIEAPTASIPSTFTRGKFSRVTVTPSFTGIDPNFVPMIDHLTNYTWTFTAAPSGSVFEPTKTVRSYMSKNENSTTDYVYDAVNDVWTKTAVETVEWTTIIDTKYVTLVYDDEYDGYNGCFAPDLDGTYTLEFSIYDYCGKKITQTYTVTAGCNNPPSANAGTDATYTFNGAGFVVDSVYHYTAVPLNGSASDPENDFLRYQWSIVSQPNPADSIVINNDRSRLATFVPTAAGVYVVRLSVTDGCTITNSTVTITVVCPNSYTVNAPINFQFDGFTPVALKDFTLLANPQCSRALKWDLIKYDPTTAIPPVTATGEVPKSGANFLAIPSLLIAFLAMIVKML